MLGILGWGKQTFPPVTLVWLKEGQARPNYYLVLLGLVLLDRDVIQDLSLPVLKCSQDLLDLQWLRHSSQGFAWLKYGF